MSDDSNETPATSAKTSAGAASPMRASSVAGVAIEKTDRISAGRLEPIVITVENNLDKAMKVLKRKLIKEGLFKELKTRRYFEKPSERRKRKQKETVKKNRKDELRNRKNSIIA